MDLKRTIGKTKAFVVKHKWQILFAGLGVAAIGYGTKRTLQSRPRPLTETIITVPSGFEVVTDKFAPMAVGVLEEAFVDPDGVTQIILNGVKVDDLGNLGKEFMKCDPTIVAESMVNGLYLIGEEARIHK
jgi:hypothetical protein